MRRNLKPKKSCAPEERRIGLARALSKLGYSSRSQAAEIIREGRVRLNGIVRRDAEHPVRIGSDRIEVDGARVAAESKIYLMLNKPRGIVTSASDEKGRDTVYSLLAEQTPWIAPVGRLDKASEGLLLLTNDSEWGARLAAPETHLDKTYHVQISGRIGDEALETLRRGVRDSGELLRAKTRGNSSRRRAQRVADDCSGRRQESPDSANARASWSRSVAAGSCRDWPAATWRFGEGFHSPINASRKIGARSRDASAESWGALSRVLTFANCGRGPA